MSPYLVAVLVTIWDWVFAPPINWVLSLSLEWKIELGLLAIAVLLGRRIIENYFVGRELSGEWLAEHKRKSEWYELWNTNPEAFTARIRALRQQAEQNTRLAERLEGRGGSKLAVSWLRKAAWRRRVTAQANHNEADRLEALWRVVEKERDKAANAANRIKVLQLMRRLMAHDERVAQEAFAEIRRMSNWFAWESLAPKDLAPQLRDRLVKFLRLMAGTSSLEESRAAYGNALRVLEESGRSRAWEVA